ncbi:MAG TPA: hypothetical protein VHD76_17265 [Bryobacteraceae bacterium]|jgi:hypothetical protein|nr:hypothetical protein [Bryobacteraceae bacterium]
MLLKQFTRTDGEPSPWRLLLSRMGDPVTLAWIGLALSLIHLYRRLGAAHPFVLGAWLSSDTLLPADVAIDLFKDGFPFSGWTFSIAPCWFPDVFLAGAFWAITRNAITATLLSGFVQPALLVGAFYVIQKAARLGSSLQTVFLLSVANWLALFHSSPAGRLDEDIFRFLIPQSHVGSLWNSVFALGLGLLLIRQLITSSRISRPLLLIYSLVCLLAGMSNLMFFPQMLFPFAVAVGIVQFLGIAPGRRMWAPVWSGWLAALFGVFLNRTLLHAVSFSRQSRITPEAFYTAMDVFTRGAVGYSLHGHPLHMLALLWILVCSVIAAVILRRSIRGRIDQVGTSERMLLLLCLCFLLADISNAGAVTVGGIGGLTWRNDYFWTTHYLQIIFYVPFFGLPMLLSWAIDKAISNRASRLLALTAAGLGLCIPACLIAATPAPKVSISGFRPPLVEFLDHLASQWGLKYGLAGYWQARSTTLMSKTGLRVYAVDGSLQPFAWVSNSYWYTEQLENRAERPRIDFVVLGDDIFHATRETVTSLMGPPLMETSFGNKPILIYGIHTKTQTHIGPLQPALIEQPLTDFRGEIRSPWSGVSVTLGETVKIPITVKNLSDRVWLSGGKYPVSVSYVWSDSGKILMAERLRTSFPHPLRPGGEIAMDAVVQVPKRATKLTLKITLVQETVAWFTDRGGASLDFPVRVQ